MNLFEIYLLGSALATGSATAAFLRGETGIAGVWWPNPPVWMLVVEVLAAALFSWVTVGFCQVQNAYRAAGNPGFSCAISSRKGK